ncbi:hypothetical protein V2A60_006201 [Cordyceps javanica]
MSPTTADKDYMANFYEVFRKRCAARKAADQRNNESRSQNPPDGKDPKIDEPYKVHKPQIRRRRRPEKRRRRKPARVLTIAEINETLHRIIGPRLDIVERKLANIRLEGDPRAAMFKEPGAGRDRRDLYGREEIYKEARGHILEEAGLYDIRKPHTLLYKYQNTKLSKRPTIDMSSVNIEVDQDLELMAGYLKADFEAQLSLYLDPEKKPYDAYLWLAMAHSLAFIGIKVSKFKGLEQCHPMVVEFKKMRDVAWSLLERRNIRKEAAGQGAESIALDAVLEYYEKYHDLEPHRPVNEQRLKDIQEVKARWEAEDKAVVAAGAGHAIKRIPRPDLYEKWKNMEGEQIAALAEQLEAVVKKANDAPAIREAIERYSGCA